MRLLQILRLQTFLMFVHILAEIDSNGSFSDLEILVMGIFERFETTWILKRAYEIVWKICEIGKAYFAISANFSCSALY